MSDRYKIAFRFRGGLTPSQRDLFVAAAARIERVIVAPLPKVAIGSFITDSIVIDAQGVAIDGPRGILGQAGPTRLRPANMGAAAFLPCAGVMSFDSADLDMMEQEKTLLDVLTHEALHVVGIGTSWTRKGKLIGAGGPNPTFVGDRCRNEYKALVSSSGVLPPLVPVENMGGPGTAGAHWRERVFANELMTGYVSSAGVANPLSRLTVASLADLGYTVDLAAADPFSLPLPAVMAEMGPPVLKPHCLPIIPFPA